MAAGDVAQNFPKPPFPRPSSRAHAYRETGEYRPSQSTGPVHGLVPGSATPCRPVSLGNFSTDGKLIFITLINNGAISFARTASHTYPDPDLRGVPEPAPPPFAGGCRLHQRVDTSGMVSLAQVQG